MVTLEGRGLLAARVVCGLSALSLLVWTFHGVNFAKVRESVAGVGALGLLLIAVPQLLSLFVECVGWGHVFERLGQPVAMKPLLRVRLMTEAVAQTLPFGVIWSESLKPLLLGRHTGMPTSRAVAGIVTRKYLLMSSQAVYVALLSACGFATLLRLSFAFTGHAGFAYAAFGISALLCLLAFAVGGAFARGRIGDRALALLSTLGSARFQQRLRQHQACFSDTDTLTERYFTASFARHTLRPGLFFLCAWLCESLESYLILHLLGSPLDFFAVASVEVLLSFLKNVLFVLPAGIGIQDVGYVSCLSALGVPDALTVGAAFSALKRGKELFWAATGYLLLAFEARPALAAAATATAPQNEVLTA
ncbi:MAG: lysylphosphatidylglycerol synthase transmembrane domain-containing protein [Pseudomonadota bacterium]